MRLPVLQETGPRGAVTGVRPWPGPYCMGPLCPLGMGHVSLQGVPGSVVVPCVSACPQQWQTRLHCPCAAVLHGGMGESVQQQCTGRTEGARALAASLWCSHPFQCPCKALGDVSVHGLPSCCSPWHWGLHACTLAGTLAPCVPQSHILCACCCAVLVPPGTCAQRCEVWASLRTCARPGSQCPVPRHSVPAMPPSCPHVGCPQTAPGTAPPPASTNPLSPLSPTGCKLSCHTKCQAKVRPVP